MTLAINSSFIPNFFEGIPIDTFTFTGSNPSPGNTLVWSFDDNENGLALPLPPGLSLSSEGLLTGIPTDISTESNGVISGTAGSYVLTTTASDVMFYPGVRIIIGSDVYTVSALSSSAGTYTLQVSPAVVASGYTNVSFRVTPLGNAKSYPVVIRLTELNGSTPVATIKRNYVITILKIATNESLFNYLELATDFDGRIAEDTFMKVVSQVSPEEKASLISLVGYTQIVFNPRTNSHESYVVLPALSTSDDQSLSLE